MTSYELKMNYNILSPPLEVTIGLMHIGLMHILVAVRRDDVVQSGDNVEQLEDSNNTGVAGHVVGLRVVSSNMARWEVVATDPASVSVRRAETMLGHVRTMTTTTTMKAMTLPMMLMMAATRPGCAAFVRRVLPPRVHLTIM